MRLKYTGPLLVAIPLFIQIICLLAVWYANHEGQEELKRQDKALKTAVLACKLSMDLNDTGLSLAFFNFTRYPLYRSEMESSRQSANATFAALSKNLQTTDSGREILKPLKQNYESGDKLIAAALSKIDSSSAMNLSYGKEQSQLQLKMSENIYGDLMSVVKKQEGIGKLASSRLESVYTKIPMLFEAALLITLVSSAIFANLFLSRIVKRILTLSGALRQFDGVTFALPEATYEVDEISELEFVFKNLVEEIQASSREEALLFEHSGDVILTLTAEMKIGEISPAVTTMLGYRQAGLAKRDFARIVPEDELSKVTAALEAVRAKKQRGSVDHLINTSIGYPINVRTSIVWSDNEQLYCLVIHDLEIRRAQTRLRQQFISVLGEDLCRPLLSIQEKLESVSQKSADITDGARSEIKSVTWNIDRLVSLIENLRLVEEIALFKSAIKLEPTSVQALLDKSVNAVEGLALQGQLSITKTKFDVDVECDTGQLVRVIVNLLSNAIKFSPPGGDITIDAKEKKEHLYIYITDSGPGIPKEFENKLFEKFEQSTKPSPDRIGKNGTSEKAEKALTPSKAASKGLAGTGLGLAICREIIEAHKGTIGAENKTEKGATFWFAIPLSQTVGAPQEGVENKA